MMSSRLKRALAAALNALSPVITLLWFVLILWFVAWLGH
jgi:hypothetical protein